MSSFLHPADTANPKLIHWLCKEEVRYNFSLQTFPLYLQSTTLFCMIFVLFQFCARTMMMEKFLFLYFKETKIRCFLTRIIDYNIRHKLKKETMFEVLARCHTQFIPRLLTTAGHFRGRLLTEQFMCGLALIS